MNRGWDDILDPGEKVLWQGRPDAHVRLSRKNIPTMIFGFVFSGFALFWMYSAAKAGAFWAFGLIHFAAGLAVALGPILIGPYLRSRTWYSLTNRRAFIATDHILRGRTLKAFPLTPEVLVDFDGDDPATIKFRTEPETLVGERRKGTPVFERIHEGRRVFSLIRDIQRGAA